MAIVMLLILFLSTPLSYTEKVQAANYSIVGTSVVHWERRTDVVGLDQNKVYRLMLVWNTYSDLVLMTSNSAKVGTEKPFKPDSAAYADRTWTVSEDIELYTKKYKATWCWVGNWLARTPNCAEGQSLISSCDLDVYPNASCFCCGAQNFYTIDGFGSWYIKPAHNGHYCHMYLQENDLKLITTNGSSGCLAKAGFDANHYESPAVVNAWRIVSDDEGRVGFCYRNDSAFKNDNFFGETGIYIYAESCLQPDYYFEENPIYHVPHGLFEMYVGTIEDDWNKIVCGTDANGNVTPCVVQSGQVLNVTGRLILPEGNKIVVEPGAVLSISDDFINNGEIINYGTVLVKSNGAIYSMAPDENSAAPGHIVNYGSTETYKDSKLKPQGNFIVMKDSIVAMNKRSNTFQLLNGAQLINNGTLISPMGFEVKDSTFINRGQIGIGWGIKTDGRNPEEIRYTVSDGRILEPQDKSNCEYPSSVTFLVNNELIDRTTKNSDKCYFSNSGTIGTASEGISSDMRNFVYSAIKVINSADKGLIRRQK